MNSRMLQSRVAIPKKLTYIAGQEVDRIPGTSKIRTYCSNDSLYSSESSTEKLFQRAGLCRDKSTED